MNLFIRNIQPSDNPIIARIVKDTLAEFGADYPDTVYYDPTTDALYELFQKEGNRIIRHNWFRYILKTKTPKMAKFGLLYKAGLCKDVALLVAKY